MIEDHVFIHEDRVENFNEDLERTTEYIEKFIDENNIYNNI